MPGKFSEEKQSSAKREVGAKSKRIDSFVIVAQPQVTSEKKANTLYS